MRQITLGTLNISQRGKDYVNEALNANRLSRGKYTDWFESEFAGLHGCEHAVFCNSGTSALQIGLATLKEVHGYEDGDEVLVPATTFIATSNIVIQNGLKPVFVDVDPYTFNMDLQANDVTMRTRCIIPVHLFGLPADMTWINVVAKHNGAQVMEDSCETMFASRNGKSVGSFGDLACFSTYVAHLIVGGVGGLVTTSNSKLAEICRSLLAHGRNASYLRIDDDDVSNENLKTIMERRYQFDRIGYSYRATELEAAIALSELERYESNIATRRANAAFLSELLKPLVYEHLQLPYTPLTSTHSFMMYPMVLKGDTNRDDFLMHLERNGIETRYMFPLLSQPIYRKTFPGLDEKFPVAKRLADRGFFIGMHQGLTQDDILYVAETIFKYFGVRLV